MASVSARQLDGFLTNWRGDSHAYSALADRIRLLILDGRVAVGARLPAERDLAQRLGVSRTTVSATYQALRELGFLTSVRGSGSVARLPGHPVVPISSATADHLDFTKASLPAAPQVADAAVRAARDLPAQLGGSGFDPIGLPALRAAIADRYAFRGLRTMPEQIMVTVGAQHAITLLSRVLLERGDRVLVESPSYPHAYESLRAAGGRLVPINVTSDDGWDVEAIDQALRRTSPALGYLMPDFHNPTGRVMPADYRERMLALAAEQGTVIVADETMAELSIDEPDPPLPMPAYGAAVSVGSLGKTAWGGIRIGWIRADPALIQRLVRARLAIDLGTPILEQLIAIDLLSSFDAILAHRRLQLRAGREHLEHLLAARFPGWRVPHVTGGLTVWASIGAPVSSQLTLAARAEGLLLAAGPLFGVDGAFERFIRIPFCYPPDQTEQAVGAIGRAWDSLAAHPFATDDYLAEVV